jgi:Bacterial Ig-like domain (group 3)/Periplasmic copper-binding protein (NosD)
VLIDGYSEAGASANTLAVGDNAVLKVELDGSAVASPQAVGLYVVGSGGTVIQGIDIHSFNHADIELDSGANAVTGNFIGTDVSGSVALAGADNDGVLVFGNGNQIGSAALGDRNLISGHTSEDGVDLWGSNTAVTGNYIGTDASGMHAVPNGSGGIVRGGTGDVVRGNLVSGNLAQGFYGSLSQALVSGNLIGTNATGVGPLGNGGYGIALFTSSNQVLGNTIAFNGEGVVVGSGAGDAIEGNSIHDNAGLGIDLGINGNDNQTAPALTYAATSGSGTSINGRLASVANTAFRVEFFSNVSRNASGFGEGLTYLGFAMVMTDGNGNASFTATGLASVPAGQAYLSATATNMTTGNTSAFSHDGIVALAALTASSNPSVLGQPVTFTATINSYVTGLGTPSGTMHFFDTTSNTDLGTVALVNGSAALNASSLAVSTHFIAVTYSGDSAFLATTCTLTQDVTQSIYVLNKKSSGALTVSGHASINISGALVVDSNSSAALIDKGNGQIAAATIQVVGGVQQSGHATLAPAASTGAAYVADPLAGLVAPTGGSGQNTVDLKSGSLTINPGIYLSIKVFGTGSLTLNPGVYIVKSGGLTVMGSGSITGGGVLIYAAGKDFCDSDDRGGIAFSGNGTFNVTGPATGPYAGVVIFQARDNTRAITLSKNAMAGIGGTIYAPAALLYLNGDATINGALVVNELTVTGDAASTQSVDGSDIAAGSTAGQLLGGDLYVYVNDPNSLFTSDQLARIQDAVNAVNTLVQPYGVSVMETTDSTLANVVIDTSTTSGAGGYADGILGCFNPTGEITMIQGWNWYAGSDPTQIGSDQYDFQTTVTHELGHALGLGESTITTSPMSATLATGTVDRALTTADLNIPDDNTGPDGQKAAALPVRPTERTSDAAAVTPEPAPLLQINPAYYNASRPGAREQTPSASLLQTASNGTNTTDQSPPVSSITVPAFSLRDAGAPTENGASDGASEPELDFVSPTLDAAAPSRIPLIMHRNGDAQQECRDQASRQLVHLSSPATDAMDEVFSAVKLTDAELDGGQFHADRPQCPDAVAEANWAWLGVLGLFSKAEMRDRRPVGKRHCPALKR